MQGMINDLLNQNRMVYQQIYTKVDDLLGNVQKEYNVLIDLNGSLPGKLSEEDQKRLKKILQNIELRFKLYDNEVDKVENSVNEFELNTAKVMDSQQGKGMQALQKNNLIHTTNDQLNLLRSALDNIKEISTRGLDLVKNIKRLKKK
jgi:hypothetical protein